jgi:hypothetical protein
MTPLWFQYTQDESWKDFNGKAYRLGEDVSEDELINMYVLKKFNFGSLVAVRDSEGGKVRVFKRAMLKTGNHSQPCETRQSGAVESPKDLISTEGYGSGSEDDDRQFSRRASL